PRRGGAARCGAPPGGEHRRDSREVVWVSRMPQAEDERHDDHDADRRSRRERCDSFVETEHHATFGTACIVIRTPASRITAALTAGRARRTTPSNLARAKTRFAATA